MSILEYCEDGDGAILNYTYQTSCYAIILNSYSYNLALSNNLSVGDIRSIYYRDEYVYNTINSTPGRFSWGAEITWQWENPEGYNPPGNWWKLVFYEDGVKHPINFPNDIFYSEGQPPDNFYVFLYTDGLATLSEDLTPILSGQQQINKDVDTLLIVEESTEINQTIITWFETGSEKRIVLYTEGSHPNPTVTVECLFPPEDQCPDGTCPVFCTDKICCYGADGIAVSSYPI